VIERSMIVLAVLLVLSGRAWADTFGPYFYRTGEEQSYCRWETTIRLEGDTLVVSQCAEQMHLLVSQGSRQCWSENYGRDDFSLKRGIIQYLSGDIERVDRRSRQFTIEDRLDRHIIVRNVTEHFGGWENTPASWQTR
jgi:hypothetical protein